MHEPSTFHFIEPGSSTPTAIPCVKAPDLNESIIACSLVSFSRCGSSQPWVWQLANRLPAVFQLPCACSKSCNAWLLTRGGNGLTTSSLQSNEKISRKLNPRMPLLLRPDRSGIYFMYIVDVTVFSLHYGSSPSASPFEKIIQWSYPKLHCQGSGCYLENHKRPTPGRWGGG